MLDTFINTGALPIPDMLNAVEGTVNVLYIPYNTQIMLVLPNTFRHIVEIRGPSSVYKNAQGNITGFMLEIASVQKIEIVLKILRTENISSLILFTFVNSICQKCPVGTISYSRGSVCTKLDFP